MTKEKITIAALRLFLLRGYKCVSLVDVANEVGITKGGIYHYFGSKEELLQAGIHHLFERIEAKCANLFGDARSLRETLNAIIVEQELELFAHRLLSVEQGDYRINHAGFALEVVHNFPELKERIDRSHRYFCDIIEQKLQKAMGKGEIRRDLDTGALAVIILAMLNGQNSLGELIATPTMRKKMMDNFWKLIGL